MITTLNWIPSARFAPCKLGNQDCNHKHENYGKCRNTCKSYAQYE